ncbi:MAG: ribonuclease P protein component 1 [Sulfolobales archaeon]
MVRSANNIVYHELIGLQARVIKHTDKTLEGCSGVVVDETMNTLIIEKDGKIITVPKFGSRIVFKLPHKDVEVRGEMLVGRPEDRVKKLRGVVR